MTTDAAVDRMRECLRKRPAGMHQSGHGAALRHDLHVVSTWVRGHGQPGQVLCEHSTVDRIVTLPLTIVVVDQNNEVA